LWNYLHWKELLRHERCNNIQYESRRMEYITSETIITESYITTQTVSEPYA